MAIQALVQGTFGSTFASLAPFGHAITRRPVTMCRFLCHDFINDFITNNIYIYIPNSYLQLY